MKKQILLLAAAFFAATTNAQVLQINAEELGYTGDTQDVAANTALRSNDAIDLSIAFGDQVKATDCKGNTYNEIIFDDANSLLTSGGITGSNNPKDADGGNPGTTLVKPASGFVMQIVAKSNGYAYVVGKLSSNKNYYVFEEGSAIGFKFCMEVIDDRVPNKVISYEALGEGEYNYITDANWCNWPIRVYLNDTEAATAGNGVGVIGFPIFEGCTYLVGAGGSKISCAGVYTSATEVSSIVARNADGETLTLWGENSTGINDITTNVENTNAPLFNLAGQRVSKNTKGLLIQNGKKFINK